MAVTAVPAKERKTIFIDLDDTLVDTFGLLITPLERAAAEAVCKIEGIPFTPEQLTAILLELRKRNPAELRNKIRQLSQSDADRVMRARDQVFSDFSIDELSISVETVEVIQQLSRDHRMVLVTEGRARIQKKKITHLGIGNLFEDVLIVDPASGISKETTIKEYMSLRHLPPRHAVIVGNRLDREIAAGNTLGIPTVWVRAGEGSMMQVAAVHGKPDATIDSIAKLPDAIRTLAAAG